LVDRRRHAPVARSRVPRLANRPQGLPHVYRGRARRSLADVYDADHAETRRSGRFRWLLSTCLAAMVGSIAIGVVIFGSLDTMDGTEDAPTVFSRLREGQFPGPGKTPRAAEGLKWVVSKADRLQLAVGAPTIRHRIRDTVQVRRDNRPFFQIRQYARIVARLQPVPAAKAAQIPPFNPFALYAPQASDQAQGGSAPAAGRNDIRLQVVELLGGTLPTDDGQELDAQEAADLVKQLYELEVQSTSMRPGFQPEGIDLVAATALVRPAAEPTPANTTVVPRSGGDGEETAEELEQQKREVVRVARGDTLLRILQRLGCEPVQARVMIAAARTVFPETALAPGHEVHVVLVPSLTRATSMEPARFSVLDERRNHKVSVTRNAAGEFVASPTPFENSIVRAAMSYGDVAQSSSVYASLYNAALLQGLPPETIMQTLRIHAYDADFRRRIHHSDQAELFFDLRGEPGNENELGELLYTSLTSGGETHRFWRFRTPDGVVDYYDELGNTSKKFLMRRPVRGETVRLASPFGNRLHPVLGYLRPHNGIDWAGPIGTPILAAGNGVIEEAGRKGEYGNYIRIRHANGYQTAYAHLNGYAPKTQEGARVRQGEVIGYIGNTGLSAGPHLHFEVLVNSRHVDPLAIEVPRERQLTGRQLAEFQKERTRIDDLIQRPPVMSEAR
jgi:murein DD-endopeptidase MepM/ murein hydrolase activator NlpD